MDCTGLVLIGRPTDSNGSVRVAVGHFLYANAVDESVDAMLKDMPQDGSVRAYLFNSAQGDNPFGQAELVNALKARGIQNITADIDGPSAIAVHVPTGTIFTSATRQNEFSAFNTEGNFEQAKTLALSFSDSWIWKELSLDAAERAYINEETVTKPRLSKVYDDREYMSAPARLAAEKLGLSLEDIQRYTYRLPSDHEARAPLQEDKSSIMKKLDTVTGNMDLAHWQQSTPQEKEVLIRMINGIPFSYLQTLDADGMQTLQKNSNILLKIIPPQHWGWDSLLSQAHSYPETWAKVGDISKLPAPKMAEDLSWFTRRNQYYAANKHLPISNTPVSCEDIKALVEDATCPPMIGPKPSPPSRNGIE